MQRLLPLLLGSVLLGGAVACAPEAEAEAVTGEDDLASSACRELARRDTPTCIASALVEQVFIGEIDPVVIGDACVIFAREPGGRLVGLVEDPGSCLATPELVGKEGATIRFRRGDVSRITRPSLRNGLRAFRADAAYYDLLGPVSQTW